LGAPVADIVASHGWDFFRQAERRLLMEGTGMVRTVLATGGGAIEHLMEWRQLRGCCYVVWLDADPATIRQRMNDDPKSAGQRPSLTGIPVCDEIEELLRRRIPLYAAGSDLHLSTDDKAPAVLVESIIKEMRLIH
jgi:shikimate kinase